MSTSPLHHVVDDTIHVKFPGRDPTFTQNAIKYISSIPLSALTLKLFPRVLRPFVAKFTTLGTRLFYSRCAHHLEYHFANRISAWHQDPAAMLNNYVDWSICDAMRRHDPAEKTPDMLSRRLMVLNFAAIHTSTMNTANMMIDVASGSAGERCLTAILGECQGLSQKYGTQWSSARLAEMAVLDSALRECMRISGFGSKAFARKVMDPAGLILPTGTQIPRGEIVCVSGYSMHHDESIYPAPYEFRHDRFLNSDGSGLQPTQNLSKTAATTEVNYGVWGHGKHACPGRFFAVHLIKMMVSYIVENYELKPWKERPANIWIAETPIPPPGLMMAIRRR